MAAGPDERPDQASPAGAVAAPVKAASRVQSLDVLRGFALLGILVPNIITFAMPMQAMQDPIAMTETVGILSEQLGTRIEPNTTWNQLGYDLTAVGFLGKFMFQFAMLFGAGVLMYGRKFDAEAKLSKGYGLWARRNAWLLAIGLVHAFGFWFGDILVWYSLVGITALWWLRRLKPGTMLAIAALSYFVGFIAINGCTAFGVWGVEAGKVAPTDLMPDIAVDLEAFRGDYLGAVLYRVQTMIFFYLIYPFTFFWMVLGLMLTGAALTKNGVLTGERSLGFYAWMAALGIGVGVPLSLLAFVGVQNAAGDHAGFIWQSIAQGVGIPQALGYTGLVILIAKLGWFRFLTSALAAVGRMALTNYLSHTLICTTIFYGHGLGYFGTIQYPQLFLMVGAIWLFNLILSPVWLHFFRFGPAEWAWRSLTYWRLQPITKPS